MRYTSLGRNDMQQVYDRDFCLPPRDIGAYRIVQCRGADLLVFYRVYVRGALDGLSDHGSMGDALRAVRRYQQSDKRRADADSATIMMGG